VADLEGILASLTLTPTGADCYTAENADSGPGVIFGGQLLAQAVVAALVGHDGKRVKTVHTVFARAGSPNAPVEIAVERLHAGRALASSAVTITQGDRICTKSIVLLTADEPDFIRHADAAPPAPDPSESRPLSHIDGWEIRVVGDVDIRDPDLVGPPTLDVWSRFAKVPDDPGVDEALLAFASDGFLIGTAMRPHAGVGQAQAHVTISTGVLSHTLTFHEPFSADEWLLLAHRSPYAGHGRCYGQASVFRQDGTLVASYVQDAMVRPLAGKPGSS
jgi:acyl-CoA thioesterase-2